MPALGVRIGDAVNLLYGFKPLWEASDTQDSPFFRPTHQPLITFDPCIDQVEDGIFGFPTITMHDDVESLISSLYDYKVLPFKNEEKSFFINSGAFVVNHADKSNICSVLNDYIGVDLKSEYGYMLVKIERKNGWSTHEVTRKFGAKIFAQRKHLTTEGRLAMSRLRPGKRLGCGLKHDALITEKQAQGYLDFFYAFGTHFVSSLHFGDYIFQVFAYTEDNFKILKKAFEKDCVDGKLTGSSALSYNYYTGRKLVALYGHLVIKSDDPEFKKTLQDNEWFDERYAKGNSIFSAFVKHDITQSTFLSRFQKIIPIGFELTPINHLIEFFRSFSCQRILKGALLQQYGNWIGFSVPRIQKDTWNLNSEDMDEVLFSQIEGTLIDASCEVLLCRDVLDADKLGLKTAKKLSILCNAIHIPDDAIISLPGASVSLAGYSVDAAEDSRKAPRLIVEDKAFEEFTLCSEKMQGVLWVENRSATKRCVIMDGFCFEKGTKDPISKRFNVRLRSMKMDVAKPKAQDLEELFAKRLLLNVGGKQNILENLYEVHSYLEWCKNLMDFSTLENATFLQAMAEAEAKISAHKALPLKEALARDNGLTFYIETRREYYEITKNFTMEVKKLSEHALDASGISELKEMLLKHFEKTTSLSKTLKEAIHTVLIERMGSGGYELVNKVNLRHAKEAKVFMQDAAEEINNYELVSKIRFQREQISAMLEILRRE